jgi:hypothetical protein
MGNGSVMPPAASTSTNGSLTPRSAKVLSVVIFGVFQHRLCRVAAEERAFDQHKVARLPVGNIDRRDTSCAGARII